jgi:hypothetical protein
MAIYNTAVPQGSAGILDSGSGNRAITTVIVCNYTAFNPSAPTSGESKLYLYAVPSGGTTGNGTMIVNGLPIPAGETVTFDNEKLVLADGDQLYAVTDVNSLTATVSVLAV